MCVCGGGWGIGGWGENVGSGCSRGVCGKLCRQFMTQYHPSILFFSGLVLFSVLNESTHLLHI